MSTSVSVFVFVWKVTSVYDNSAVHCEVAEIKTCLSEWLSEWQGHLLSCPGQLKILCPPNVDGAKRSKSSKATSLSWRRSTGDVWKLFLCHYWPMTTPLLFLRQFLNPSKVEEYLQLVEKTQGVEFRFCNLALADREEVALPVGVWFMLTMKHFCAHVLLWWAL